MRQWGSSLNHNGMSFYPARVPKGTQLYHGSGNNSTITGMEWLAFEPEHALLFARSLGHRPGRTGPRSSSQGTDQSPLKEEHEAPFPQPTAGWLHTYSTKRDLNLLYIDGMSAGKTTNGTLDSQDYIILNSSAPAFFFNDYERAQNMCTMAEEVWQGRIDGYLRMEMGFEVVLCDFERNLDEILITRRKNTATSLPFGPVDDTFSYWRAITDRYNGIGGHRVTINYEDFFTTYLYDLDLFNHSLMPRLEHLPAEDLAMLRSGLDDFILKDPNPFARTSIDWQAVADLIVTRYAKRLKYLTSDEVLQSNDQLKGELERALAPFIDYDQRDPKLEIERCTFHFLPTHAPITLAAKIITHVSQYLCTELVESLQSLNSSEDTTIHQSIMIVQHRLRELMQNLNWTVWKECGPCKSNEVCFIPIWPHGSFADWLKPSCLNATEIPTRNGYWGMRGGRGPRPNGTSEDTIGA